jgi:hypothetical protein
MSHLLSFSKCSSCSRRVRVEELRCPFCEASLEAAPPAIPGGRLRRAAILTVGIALCAGGAPAACGGHVSVDTSGGQTASGNGGETAAAGGASAVGTGGVSGPGGAGGSGPGVGGAGNPPAVDPTCTTQHTSLPPGEPPQSPGCSCDSSAGITVKGACGAWTLAASYAPGDPDNFCDLPLSYAASYQCKDHTLWRVFGCHAAQTTPCAQIVLKREGSDKPFQIGGHLLDGDGVEWTLEGTTGEPMLGVESSSTVTHSLVATATRDGGVSVDVSIEFDVCIGYGTVCPI